MAKCIEGYLRIPELFGSRSPPKMADLRSRKIRLIMRKYGLTLLSASAVSERCIELLGLPFKYEIARVYFPSLLCRQKD